MEKSPLSSVQSAPRLVLSARLKASEIEVISESLIHQHEWRKIELLSHAPHNRVDGAIHIYSRTTNAVGVHPVLDGLPLRQGQRAKQRREVGLGIAITGNTFGQFQAAQNVADDLPKQGRRRNPIRRDALVGQARKDGGLHLRRKSPKLLVERRIR